MSRIVATNRVLIYQSGSTIVNDLFTDTDATLLPAHTPNTANNGAIWVKEDGEDLTITSNSVNTSAITPGSLDCFHSIDAQLQDLTVDCDITITDTDNSSGYIAVRYIDSDNWMGIHWQQWSGFVRAATIVSVTAGGAVTTLATFGAISASVDGTALAFSIASTATGITATATDTSGNTYSASHSSTAFNNATKIGIAGNQNLISFDNFTITKT
jgi:hypothetical protein